MPASRRTLPAIGRFGRSRAPFALAPFDHFRLPFAMMYGFLLFAKLPDLYTLLGASIIVFQHALHRAPASTS